MTGADDQSDQMTDLGKMAATMADYILELHEAGTSIPPGQFRMIVRAARMLLDGGVPWPPSVERVIMEVALRISEPDTVPTDPSTGSEGGDAVVHLRQVLSAEERQRRPAPDNLA